MVDTGVHILKPDQAESDWPAPFQIWHSSDIAPTAFPGICCADNTGQMRFRGLSDWHLSNVKELLQPKLISA